MTLPHVKKFFLFIGFILSVQFSTFSQTEKQIKNKFPTKFENNEYTNKSYTTFDDVDLYSLQAYPNLYRFMENWIGTPYRLGGTNRRGVDCTQFNIRLYKDVYNLDLENTAQKQWEQTLRISKDFLSCGDLVFFRNKLSQSSWHTGVYIGNSFFIHASKRNDGVRINSIDEPIYKEEFIGSGRLLK